jgi:putative ATP-dependent endonuclease of the OLD family
MKLKRLRLRNFRCYREEISIDFNDITALVGKNDSGKSTIMDALDIFLNDSNPDKDDASKNGDGADLTIIGEFDLNSDYAIIDDTVPTRLADEHLLNSDGRLEIHKKYSGNLQSPKCTDVSAYARHPSIENASDLMLLKRPQLRARANQLGVNLDNVDQNINKELRSAIRNHMGNLNLTDQFVPLNEENGKKVWDALKSHLPVFALFKSDRASTDQDPEAQDPLKAAVKEAIKAKEEELNKIFNFVEREVKKIADATLDKLKEMDSSLASQLNPQFSKPSWANLFKASITGDEGIPINKRGSGVKRLILLNFFRAKAENQASETGRANIIYGIEEPETSQHPNNQRMLLKALTELSIENQVIISTHTPMLARGLDDECLRYIQTDEDGTRSVLKGGSENNAIFAKSLGVLPDNSVKLFIGVEGKNDIMFFHNISKTLSSEGIEVTDLEKLELEGKILFFPLGGSTLALWTSRLEVLNRPEYHLYDRDNEPPAPAAYQAEIDEVNSHNNCSARCTNKKELENYVHKTAIEQAYALNGLTIRIAENFQAFDNVPIEVAKIVHSASDSPIPWEDLDKKKKEEKESKAKKVINGIATRFMRNELLNEIDPDNELIGWLQEIEEIVNDEYEACPNTQS